MAAGLGMGAGMAMAERMARTGPWGAAPEPSADPAAAPRRRGAGTSRSRARPPAPTPATSSGAWSSDGIGHRRQLALDPGRARLAARPRRLRARRPLQRAAAAAGLLRSQAMQLGPAAGGEAIELQDHRFPCPTCGSDLRFDPDTDGLKCAHCGHEEADPRGARPDPRARPARGGEGQRCRRPRCRRPASPTARTAARRSSSGSTSTPASARSAPRPSSPTPARTRQIKPQAQLPFLLERGARRGRR